ncbi:helix-turn-helix transcriptional regulator [Caulobacter segnis]|nr:helix-turn-helix transcriptional regulator [Caulobacter segnis]
MESSTAVQMLSALGQEARLAIFRLLVKAGDQGVAAGDIARALSVLPNSLSANLNVLSRAGLIRSRREGRSIIYFADYGAMSGMLGFLLEDCCGGAPAVCAPLNAILSRQGGCIPACAPSANAAQ